MRVKLAAPRRPEAEERQAEADATGRGRRIRADLERRGVARDFSSSITERLVPFYDELTPEAYEAVLSGVAMAYGVHRRGLEAAEAEGRRSAERGDAEEIERLMKGFAAELRKLDEALETLAAYVSRLRGKTSDPDRTLH